MIEVKYLKNHNSDEYDFETESDRFDVSGINSHNCRSFLTVWKDENGKPKFYGRLTPTVKPSLNCVNAYQSGVKLF